MAVSISEFVLARLDDLDTGYSTYDTYPIIHEFVEFSRYICKFHESWPVKIEGDLKLEYEPTHDAEFDRMWMSMTQQVAFKTEQQYREIFGQEPPAAPIMRQLAVRWAHHPDYNPEWTP